MVPGLFARDRPIRYDSAGVRRLPAERAHPRWEYFSYLDDQPHCPQPGAFWNQPRLLRQRHDSGFRCIEGQLPDARDQLSGHASVRTHVADFRIYQRPSQCGSRERAEPSIY